MSYTVVQVPFGETSDISNHDLMLNLANEFNAQGTAAKTFKRENAVEVTTSRPYSGGTGATFIMKTKDEARSVREGWVAFAEESDALAFVKAYNEQSEDAPTPIVGSVEDPFCPHEWDYV